MAALKILDTDVFIDHFRGLAAATAYIQGLTVAQRATTDVTVMELYRGAANREQLATIVRFLARNQVTRVAYRPPRRSARSPCSTTIAWPTASGSPMP